MSNTSKVTVHETLYLEVQVLIGFVNDMKKDDIINYNEKVGESFDVSKDGVLTVDVDNVNFRKEIINQLELRKLKMETKTAIHPNINSIRDHSVNNDHEILDVDKLVKTVKFCSTLAEWRKPSSSSRQILKGELVLTCPEHWTLQDVQCALHLSSSSYRLGYSEGTRNIQFNIANLLNLKSEED
jgi:hypothetical protein